MTSDDLRQWMERESWSVRRLAGALGVAPQTVQRWRDGSRPCPPWLHLALAGIETTE